MISFKLLAQTSTEALLCDIGEDADAEYLGDILASFRELEAEGGTEVGVCLCRDCLLVRICSEGEYMFIYPIRLCDGADAQGACREIAAYSMRELIPLRFTDVPREELAELGGIFPHMDARAYDDDDDTFFVGIRNESDKVESDETFTFEDITLDFLRESDGADYAALCSDSVLNRYWGYDAYADNADADPQFYLETARREYESGVAITLAIRRGKEFIGEAVVFDFDYAGAASVGVRLLPRFHGLGLGRMSARAVIAFCRHIGLEHLYASVMEENSPSVRIFSALMIEVGRENGRISYKLDI